MAGREASFKPELSRQIYNWASWFVVVTLQNLLKWPQLPDWLWAHKSPGIWLKK